MSDTQPASPLPPSAKAASQSAITQAISETEAQLTKVASLSKSVQNPNESLEEGEIKEEDIQEAEEEEDVDPNRQVTVFSSHQKFNVVHPLFNGW